MPFKSLDALRTYDELLAMGPASDVVKHGFATLTVMVMSNSTLMNNG